MITLVLMFGCVSGGKGAADSGLRDSGLGDSGGSRKGEMTEVAVIDGGAAITASGEMVAWSWGAVSSWSSGWRSLSGFPDYLCAQGDASYLCWAPAYGNGDDHPELANATPLAGDWANTQCTSLDFGDADTCCALNSAGGLYCWDPEGDEWLATSGVTSFAGVKDDVIYVQDGQVAWSDADLGDGGSLVGEATAVAQGAQYFCALRPDGTLKCADSPSDRERSGDPPEGSFTQVSMGVNVNCAVGTDEAIRCWEHQFYDGPWRVDTATPPAGTYTQVSVSDGLGCAVNTDGCVICWSDQFTDGEYPGTPSINHPLCYAGQDLRAN